MNKLREKVRRATVRIFGNEYSKELKCKFSIVTNLMTRVACSAERGTVEECWSKISESLVASEDAFSGISSRLHSASAQVDVGIETISSEQDNVHVEVVAEDVHQLADMSHSQPLDQLRRLEATNTCKE